MPKNPPDLPLLLASPDPTQRVKIQSTAFTDDVLGRFVCNDWGEIRAGLADGGAPFDAVVIGAGMFGAYCAEKLYRHGSGVGMRILVLDAGSFTLPEHVQNLPQLGGALGNAPAVRTRDTGTQNVVWGMPWISDTTAVTNGGPSGFPGLAYTVGGRSLFWGGWSPQLTPADLTSPPWPADVVSYLTTQVPGDVDKFSGYQRTAVEIGTATTTDFMFNTRFHGTLRTALQNAIGTLPVLTAPVEEAPLAVEGASPASGLFAFDKFSSAPAIINATRDDVATNTSRGDVSRRIFLVPRTQVLRLNMSGGAVTGIDVSSNGIRDTLPLRPGCAVVLANGTIEATRLALESLGVGDTRFGSPRVGNLMAHLRSNITVRIQRSVLGLATLGQPGGPPPDLETTAFLVRGASAGRRFHFQVIAAAVGSQNPETNLFQQIPDIDLVEQIQFNQDPNWIVFVIRGIGEMTGDATLTPNPAGNWIDLSGETDPFGKRRAFVRLGLTGTDAALWATMDVAALDLAETMAGGPGAPAGSIQYLVNGNWVAQRPAVDPTTGGPWRDPLGSTHHEAGPLFMGNPGASVTNSVGRFHNISNAYVAGPAVFPAIGSANPSLTALTLARRTADAIIAARAGHPFP
ncbi:MAG TPA: GMC oxidoreductase [Kineosporiaceae bacterium]|nr:GMC oxidoreductase [Kineosporiaceae bacterium]